MCSRRAPAVPQACAMISEEAPSQFSGSFFPVRTTLDAVTLAGLSLSPPAWMAAPDRGPGRRGFDTNPPAGAQWHPTWPARCAPGRLWSRWWIGTAGSRFPTEPRATQLLRTVTWIFLQFWWISERGEGGEEGKKKEKINALIFIWWVICSVRKRSEREEPAACAPRTRRHLILKL